MAYQGPGVSAPAALSSTVEIHVQAMNIPKLDTLSKSDPMCVLEIRSMGQPWREIGRTEVKKNDHNPKWITGFKVEYHFEILQELKFSVYDADSQDQTLSAHDYVGSLFTTLGELVASPGQRVRQKLVNPDHRSRNNGVLTCLAEELSTSGMQATILLRGEHLDKKDFWSKSDPYFIIHRSREDGVQIPVYKSKAIKNTLDPQWPPFTLSMTDLCNDDLDRPMYFECWDKDWGSSDDLIGSFQFNMRQWTEGVGQPVPLINPKKVAKKGPKYKNSGIIRPVRVDLFKQPSFLDFIMGGCQVNLLCAIDFTASNGNPANRSSLHYRGSGGSNQYIDAIQAVGPIVMEYDTDKQVPAFGFGARLPPNNQVSHCFALNGNTANPEVSGVDGLLEAYNQAVNNVTLHGPTIFTNIINYAAGRAADARVSQQRQSYYILLILTDGEITDMNNTIDAIISASDLPLSIIIVGVGDADFSRMDALDGDAGLLTYNGRRASRDIVQFVPFRKFKNSHYSALAKETLAEIPHQVLSYFSSKNIVPNPPTRTESMQGGQVRGRGGAPPPPSHGPGMQGMMPPMGAMGPGPMPGPVHTMRTMPPRQGSSFSTSFSSSFSSGQLPVAPPAYHSPNHPIAVPNMHPGVPPHPGHYPPQHHGQHR